MNTTIPKAREMGRKQGGNFEGNDIAAVIAAMKTRDAEVKSWVEDAHQHIADIGPRLLELEQKLARRGGSGAGSGSASWSNGSLALAVKNDPGAIAFKKGSVTNVRIPVSDFGRKGTIVSDGPTPAIMPFAQNVPGILGPLVQGPTLEDLLPHAPMTTGIVQWLREKAGGDVVAIAQAQQGELKKEGSLEFEKMSSEAATAAVWMKFSKQVLDDQEGLASYVEQRLRYGVDLGVERLLLSGTGLDGQNEGLLLPANHTAFDGSGMSTTATMFDFIRRAKKQVRVAQGKANALLLHPDDAEALDITKDATGNYITGGPVSANGTVWGLTPIESTEFDAGTFVVADFARASVFYDRQDAALLLGYEGDDMVKNLITMLLERRFAVAWNRPALIVVGEFATAH